MMSADRKIKDRCEDSRALPALSLEDEKRTHLLSHLSEIEIPRISSLDELQSKWGALTRVSIIGGQWPCDYSILGSKSMINYLIWYNHRTSVRRLFLYEIKEYNIWIYITIYLLGILYWILLRKYPFHIPLGIKDKYITYGCAITKISLCDVHWHIIICKLRPLFYRTRVLVLTKVMYNRWRGLVGKPDCFATVFSMSRLLSEWWFTLVMVPSLTFNSICARSSSSAGRYSRQA